MNITDFLLTGIGKVLSVGALFAGFWLFYRIVLPSFNSLRRIIETGKALTWQEQKEALVGLGIELGKMIFVPVLVLVAVLTSMQIALPAIYDISDFLSQIIEDVSVELGSELDTGYSDRMRDNDPNAGGGGYPTPVLIPTPMIMVVTATPQPAPTVEIRVPDILVTPTRERTFP